MGKIREEAGSGLQINRFKHAFGLSSSFYSFLFSPLDLLLSRSVSYTHLTLPTKRIV